MTFQRQLNIRWKRARPWLQPLVSTFTLPEEAACPGSTLQLLGMDENGVVVRCTSSSSPVRTWAEEIKLMVVERDKHWEVGITPSDKSEIFYRAEITKTMVAAVTDLGTVAVWHRATKQLIHCRLIVPIAKLFVNFEITIGRNQWQSVRSASVPLATSFSSGTRWRPPSSCSGGTATPWWS